MAAGTPRAGGPAALRAGGRGRRESGGVVPDPARKAGAVRVRGAAGLRRRSGTLAERAAVPEVSLAVLPDEAPDDLAAALGVVGITALLALERAAPAGGERVLVLGATGAVGQMAVQLAKLHGSRAGGGGRAQRGAARAGPRARRRRGGGAGRRRRPHRRLRGGRRRAARHRHRRALGRARHGGAAGDRHRGAPRQRRASPPARTSACRSSTCGTARARFTRSPPDGPRSSARRACTPRSSSTRSRDTSRWTARSCRSRTWPPPGSGRTPRRASSSSISLARMKLVGRPVRRREDERILRGGTRYLDDIDPPGAAHVAFVRSPFAHARIGGVEVPGPSAGVLAVITAADIEGRVSDLPVQGFEGGEVSAEGHPVLAGDEVRYAGQPVAAVLAESRALAEDAAELVEIDYEPLEPVLDARGSEVTMSRWHKVDRRRGRRLRVRRPRRAREPRASPARSGSDGAARRDRLLRRGRRHAHGLGLGAGQPPPARRPGEGAGPAGGVDPRDRPGRGRRVREQGGAGAGDDARRRGGDGHRPHGQVGRGPGGELRRLLPGARHGGGRGAGAGRGRDHPRRYAPASGRTWAAT